MSENRDDLYRKMARGPNDINLFPSLTNPYSQDYDNDRGGRDRGFGNNKRRQSEGNRYYDNGLDDDYDDSRYNQNSNSRRVVRYSEGDDRSRRNHQHDNRNYDPRRESNGSYSNDRNNSYANNKRKRFDDDGGELEVFERRDYKRNNTNNQQQYAQQPARSNFNSNQNPQSSKEWQDRIESRKKRFSE